MSPHDNLLALEQRLLEPAVRADRAAVDALLADDFREFGSSGRVFSKREIIAALAAEAPREIALHDFACQPVAPDAALVTYRSRSEGGEALRSSLWICRDGRWAMVFHQGTKVPSPMNTDTVF